MLRIVLAIGCFSMVVACSPPSMSVTEYAAEVELLVAEMESRFATIDREWESQTPSVRGAQVYWQQRLDIRNDFLEAVEALAPPFEIASMHDDAVEVFTRITTADEELARRVARYTEVTEHRQWLDTPEGAASLAILEDVFEFCRSSQATFDATESRGEAADVPWIPQEMKLVVSVAFGCPPP